MKANAYHKATPRLMLHQHGLLKTNSTVSQAILVRFGSNKEDSAANEDQIIYLYIISQFHKHRVPE